VVVEDAATIAVARRSTPFRVVAWSGAALFAGASR